MGSDNDEIMENRSGSSVKKEDDDDDDNDDDKKNDEPTKILQQTSPNDDVENDDDVENANQEEEDDDDDEAEGDDDDNDNNQEDQQDDNDEDEEEEEGDDDKNDDNDSSAEDEDDDSDDESDDDSDDENDGGPGQDGISEYERLRLERIKRNQERLKQLGLHDDGLKPKRKKRSRTKSSEVIEQRERLSRKSKTKEVDYSGDLNLRAIRNAEKDAQRKARKEQKRSQGQNKPSKERTQDKNRVPLFIYQEFQRIRSTRKEHIKQAKRYVRDANREIKYWQQQMSFITNKERSNFLREKLIRQQQVERDLLNGKTQSELLLELDQRLPELKAIVQKYDTQQRSVQEQERQRQIVLEEWNKKQALDRKLQMIDVLESFPKSMNDAMATLNALLLARSPKDPPPPRRSKRSAEEEEELLPKKKRAKTKATAASPNGQDFEASWGDLTASLAAAARDTTKTTVASMDVADDATTTSNNNNNNNNTKKKKLKDARNVGGWVSPIFSQQLDRYWLERTKPLKRINAVPPTAVPKGGAMPVFDLNAYVAQPGDIVLFYPSAYRDFLQVHPDILGSRMRNVLRVPLWIRARRQLGRLKQGTASDEDKKVWFTEEWVLSLLGKKADDADDDARNADSTTSSSSTTITTSLGDYPIICQVTRTHTEFPPDPYSKDKSISKSGQETTITWSHPPAAAAKIFSSKQNADRPKVRLVVTLKPFSKVIPPNFDKRAPSFAHPTAMGRYSDETNVIPATCADLTLPPNFSVVTCPVGAPLEPFLVPFCYAYTLYHSLSLGDSMYIRRAENEDYYKVNSKTKRAGKRPLIQGKGRVVGFATAREGESLDDTNPMVGDPLQDTLGEDPFGLQDALGADGLAEVHEALGVEGLGGDTVEWQEQQHHHHPQRPIIERSFRLEDRSSDLDVLISSLTANGTFNPEALEEALAADDNSSAIPFREANIIYDFLTSAQSTLKNKKSNGECQSQISKVSFMEFIHCTLPIRRGVTVSLDANRRHIHRTCPWHLVHFHPTEFVRNMQDGFLASLDSATREKAVMGLEDVIQNFKPNSDLFYSAITEDEAPGYYCAVPIPMFFERIFARLKANIHGRCYYSSVESIIMDLRAISENCMLFNSPDSELVTFCNNMILECKKFVANLSKTTTDGANIKQRSNTTGIKKRSTLVIPDDLNSPYKGKLYREWIQRIVPDVLTDTNQRDWIPQCGDTILYSRSRHKDFIKAHLNSLAEIQCILPQFDLPSSSPDGSTVATLDASTMSHWMKGTIVSVRATFPQAPTGKLQETFDQPAPILALEIQMNYTWCQDTTLLFWRPCILPKAGLCANDKCPTCRLSSDSFLQPQWAASKRLTILDSASIPVEIPGILNEDSKSALKRCFDLLMRRCLVGIPPSYVNPQEALSLAERNAAINPGSRSLPSFEDLLLQPDPGKKSTNTRGVKKTEELDVVKKLENSGFLPPWSPEMHQNNGRKEKHTTKHEELLPLTSLCLELIRLRVSTGYYRNAMAIVNDISESFVTSVLFILSGPASRKTNRLSIRKITKYLASPRGSPKMPKIYYKKKKSVGGNESAPSQPKESEPDNLGDFTSEETMLIERISHLRSFHAAAIVFATQSIQIERLFCLRSVPVPLPPDLPAIVPVESNNGYSEEQLEGIAKIRWVLEAIERDPTQNRIQFAQFANTKKFNLKITCGGQRIAENGELQTMADGVTYFQPSSLLARTPEGQSVRLSVRCGGETIQGERRPVANPLENSGWPMPIAGPQPISLDSVRDSISLGFQQFEKNDGLSRALLGLPGRRFPCVRCQSRGLSTLQCRVQKGHSNLDFSIIEHFQGTCGVESLFLPWKSDQESNISTLDTVEEEEKVDMKEVEDEKEARVKELEEEEKKAEATREQRAKEAEENLAKAQAALKTAQYLAVQADRLNELEVKLSDEFVGDYFPVDPEDNHYIFCIHCGTAGNLLLCEGCSNVSHPECAGLAGIPDGDWYCARCVKEKGLSSAVQPSAEGKTGKSSSEPTDSLAQVEPKPSNEVTESATMPTEPKGDEKKAEFDDKNSRDVEEAPTVDVAQEVKSPGKLTDTTHTKDEDQAQDAKPPAAATAIKTKPKINVPLPEMTDEEFEAKASELEELIEGLSSQHEEPKPKLPKPKINPVEVDDNDGMNNDAPASGKKRGRPRKIDATSPQKVGRKRSKVENRGETIQALSDMARTFLETLSITTGDAFLAAGTTQLGNDLIKWRKKQGMPPLKGSGHIATISGWKTMVRNAGTAEFPSDDESEENAEVLPESKPRSRASIEKRAAALAKSPQSTGNNKRQRSDSPAKMQKAPRSDKPIQNLPVQGRSFCEYLKITDPEDFLSQRTSDLAAALVKFRRKLKMPPLAGSSPSAFVAMWKTQLRLEVAHFKSLEAERDSERAAGRKTQHRSKVQDVEVVVPTNLDVVKRRGRSRPPSEASKSTGKDAASPTSPAAKRRGRPPSAAPKSTGKDATSPTSPAAKRRDRSPSASSKSMGKDATSSTSPAAKPASKARGRPKKTTNDEDSKNDSARVSFNVLEEAQKLAEEDAEPQPPGRRRRLLTNRYTPE
ncbi:bromodomain containing protein [Nitzschia inconspicua]|uniref:Bromodomain containing protein n=1 Tax=Nitzschia inconspicua TaxID=303405 RepID=A0A9K3PXW9_9STRA|nr:bromodomain containing protein [Nitzschia inconspicua]